MRRGRNATAKGGRTWGNPPALGILISISPSDIRLIHLARPFSRFAYLPGFLPRRRRRRARLSRRAARKPWGSIVYHDREGESGSVLRHAPGIWRCYDNPAYWITYEKGLYIQCALRREVRGTSRINVASPRFVLQQFISIKRLDSLARDARLKSARLISLVILTAVISIILPPQN